jgi:hypothetical protein
METNQKIQYDQQIEVTKNQYDAIVKLFSGLVAHRHDKEENKYYIKLWFMKYATKIKYVIDSVK